VLAEGADALALEYLNYRTMTYADVTGTGKKQIGFSEVDIATATRYSGEDADIALRLKMLLEPKLREQGLDSLFRDVEMNLLRVLVDMEFAGVKIDAGLLKIMSRKLENMGPTSTSWIRQWKWESWCGEAPPRKWTNLHRRCFIIPMQPWENQKRRTPTAAAGAVQHRMGPQKRTPLCRRPRIGRNR
jgi:hypothetical protein